MKTLMQKKCSKATNSL